MVGLNRRDPCGQREAVLEKIFFFFFFFENREPWRLARTAAYIIGF